VWTGAVAIIIFGVLAYSNSFQGAFVFDDVEIASNTALQKLWPIWPSMFAPQNMSRPLIGLSLAVNYAISGLNVWSYHLVNLLIHLTAALALFGIVRRTLLSQPLRERFGPHAFGLALVIALIWTVHPLQTQAVTYIIQRGESLMGMCYLLTLYCGIRSFDAPNKTRWYVAAILLCLAGMLSKPVMVTAPLMVLIYDYLFTAGPFKATLRKRWPLYVGLAATWAALAAILAAAPTSPSAGFEARGVRPLEYFVSQFGVLVHYLRLSVWPQPLVLDYGWPRAKTAGEIIPYAIIIGSLAAATVWALVRRKPLGFLGAWFFLILGLTSSVLPISDLAFEHRMYLPLAAVVALVVIGGYVFGARWLSRLASPKEAQMQLGRTLALVLATAVLVGLTFLTLGRNVDYQSPIAMWRDVVNKRPENPRGYSNLAKLLAERGQMDEALANFAKVCELRPTNSYAHNNLGAALTQVGNLKDGESQLLEALRFDSAFADAHRNLGNNLAAQGRFDEAYVHLDRAIQLDPQSAEAYFALGLALEKQSKMAEAIDSFRTALRLQPDLDGALIQLALALATQDDPKLRNTDEALRLAQQAVSLTGGQHPVPLNALATVYAEAGRFTEAIATAQKAAELASASGDKEMTRAIEARLRWYREGHAR
jgi:protein O-mannosyl-transferase